MDSSFQRLLEELGTRARAEIEQVAAAARERNAALSNARHAGRRTLLAAQHALVERVLDASGKATIRKLGLCVNVERLVSRADELAAYAGNGAVEVRCQTALAEQITSRLGCRQVRVVSDDAAPWGLTLTADGGRLVIEDTVDAWLAARRSAIAIDVCRRIEEVV